MIKELDEQRIREKNLRIEQDNQILKELNFKKDKFFSIIAHDLKSPIGAIIHLGQMLQEDHNNMIITISDNGVGIKPEIVKELFDLDSDHTTRGTNNETGTGLGLKLCK